MKILISPCYKDYFLEANHPYNKHLTHSHCKCEEKHDEIFVHFCKSLPFGITITYVTDPDDVVEKKCFCERKRANEICQLCIVIRHTLNFKCHKLCLEKVPDFMRPEVNVLDRYLKELHVEPLFYFENNRVEISLDNPEMEKIPVRTDYRSNFSDNRPVLSRS